jgi:hypothetical protein
VVGCGCAIGVEVKKSQLPSSAAAPAALQAPVRPGVVKLRVVTRAIILAIDRIRLIEDGVNIGGRCLDLSG